jgi:hypothetical protein
VARELLYVQRMALTRASAPDLVTLASLHAALDGILEIEALFTQIQLPFPTLAARERLHTLAAEMRTQLVELLRPEPR